MPLCKRTSANTESRSLGRHNFVGPFVTAVGGTTGIPPKPEVAHPFSGGGFSLYFDTPDYQKIEVATYVESLKKKYKGLYRFVLSCCPK